MCAHLAGQILWVIDLSALGRYIPPSKEDIDVLLAGLGHGVTASIEAHEMGSAYADN